MKRRSFPLLLSVMAMGLASCGASKVTGVYAFQMGKAKGVHMAVSMNLLSSPFKSATDGKILGDTFRFVVDIKTNSGSSSSSSVPSSSNPSSYSSSETTSLLTSESLSVSASGSSSPDASQSWSSMSGIPSDDSGIQTVLKLIYELLGDGEAVVGYYKVGDPIQGGGKQLHLGVDIDDEFLDMLASLLQIDKQSLQLTPEMTEKIIYSTIADKAVNISIPVSMDDLLFQLYWYGYDLHTEDGSFHFDNLPITHAPGSHPTAEEVAVINADATFKAHHPNVTYRDYYTVTLGLIKQ